MSAEISAKSVSVAVLINNKAFKIHGFYSFHKREIILFWKIKAALGWHKSTQCCCYAWKMSFVVVCLKVSAERGGSPGV